MFIERQIVFMNEIIRMHDEIKNIHVSLEKLYPITVIHNGYFFVFDINETGNVSQYNIKYRYTSHNVPSNRAIVRRRSSCRLLRDVTGYFTASPLSNNFESFLLGLIKTKEPSRHFRYDFPSKLKENAHS